MTVYLIVEKQFILTLITVDINTDILLRFILLGGGGGVVYCTICTVSTMYPLIDEVYTVAHVTDIIILLSNYHLSQTPLLCSMCGCAGLKY